MAVETNFFPLWEYERGKLRFTHPIENPKPVREYTRLIGKYTHLNREQTKKIQGIADDRLELLKQIRSKDLNKRGTPS
jgi:pyruvate/2-oxoacid:ferredoxin oxidoreductase beta subunit